MAIHYLSSALESLVGAKLRPSRDGVLIQTKAEGQYDFVTRYLDEPAVLAAVDALAAALRARGVQSAINAADDAPPPVPPPFSSAFAVADVPPPEDIVIRGGKVSTVPTHAPVEPAVEPAAAATESAPETAAEPRSATHGTVRRRKAAK